MRSSGAYTRNRISFERQMPGVDDGHGNILQSSWTEVCACSAAFRPEFGREQLAAGRLESIMRGTVTVRSTAATRAVTTADRIRFSSGPYAGTTAQIRSSIASLDAREIEFMIESNMAT